MSGTFMLIGAAPPSDGLVKGTLRELGVESYWERISPLVTEYGVRVIGALLFLFMAMYIASVASRATLRALERAKVEATLAHFLASVARVLVIGLAVITCMSIVGIPVTSFAAVVGAGGLAVGLALQGSLSNIAAGAALSITRPFRVGDFVVVAAQKGVVDEIGLFTTILHTPDNRRVIIPNGQIFGTIIENVTHHPVRRVQLNIGVDINADIDSTRAALNAAVRAVAERTESPEPQVLITGFSDFAQLWEVNLWARSDDLIRAKESLIREAKRSLDAAGIAIPLPQRVIHVRQAEQGGAS